MWWSRLGGSHETHCVDLTDIDQLSSFVSEIINRPLDLLINNAGITHRSQASATDTKVFGQLMSVNWFAPVFLTQRCLPALQQAGGSVICISSMAAKMPVPGRAAYCASKSAMAQHFETWRPELIRQGIDLLMVYPSFLNTSIEANALGSDGNRTSSTAVNRRRDPWPRSDGPLDREGSPAGQATTANPTMVIPIRSRIVGSRPVAVSTTDVE